jgi:hypothetical protein
MSWKRKCWVCLPLIVGLSLVLVACTESISLGAYTATIGALFTSPGVPVTAAYAPVAANPGGTYGPPGFILGPGLVLTGTPNCSQFGTWPIRVTGTYGGSWIYGAWTATGTVVVAAPTISYSPVTPSALKVVASVSPHVKPTITLTVAPVCACTITLASTDPHIILKPTTITTSAAGPGPGGYAFTIDTSDTTERPFTVTATINSTAPGTAPATATISSSVE